MLGDNFSITTKIHLTEKAKSERDKLFPSAPNNVQSQVGCVEMNLSLVFFWKQIDTQKLFALKAHKKCVTKTDNW